MEWIRLLKIFIETFVVGKMYFQFMMQVAQLAEGMHELTKLEFLGA